MQPIIPTTTKGPTEITTTTAVMTKAPTTLIKTVEPTAETTQEGPVEPTEEPTLAPDVPTEEPKQETDEVRGQQTESPGGENNAGNGNILGCFTVFVFIIVQILAMLMNGI